MTLDDWLPATMASAPRAVDSRLTGVRIPYDIETARRIYAKGDPCTREGGVHGYDFGATLRYRHAEAVVIAHDRNRLISETRD